MPKKKTGQRKKADKQKARQKEIRNKGSFILKDTSFLKIKLKCKVNTVNTLKNLDSNDKTSN
jgi:hypothetical protein